MIIVGITGAIGSGKTTVCKEWEKLGAKVIYADNLAKKLMVEDPEIRNQLIKAFGEETYQVDGRLNRSHLIRHAFEENRVAELNKIVHPAVAKKFKEICTQAERDGEKMIVEEAALLLNNGRPENLDIVVIVTSDREDRVQRVIKRDSITRQKVIERDEKQPDFKNLIHLADYTIKNNGTLEELKKRSKEIFQLLFKNHR